MRGPKWCGKTITATQFSKSILKMDDSENKNKNLILVDTNVKELLSGDTPRLIDEWQIAPKLWDAVRNEIDRRDKEGQFIFTGSLTPVESQEITHSGAGRFSWITMRTMSLYKSGDSTGEVSLSDLFEKKDRIFGINKISFEKLAVLICRGGWPKATRLNDEEALDLPYDYINAITRTNIDGVNKSIKNPERMERLLKSYARNQGCQVTKTYIRDDILNNDNENLNEDTIGTYINMLKRMYVIEDMPAWNPNIRSKTSIRTSDTRYFIDPSIAVASLGIGPADLMNDIKTFGFLFETMCVRDLRVYAQTLNGKVYHYRDKSGLECDCVVHLRNGRYGLIEIKLGGDDLIEEAVKNLKKLESIIDDTKMNKPAFMMVLVGLGSYAYKREDGIYVVPVGCLKN